MSPMFDPPLDHKPEASSRAWTAWRRPNARVCVDSVPSETGVVFSVFSGGHWGRFPLSHHLSRK